MWLRFKRCGDLIAPSCRHYVPTNDAVERRARSVAEGAASVGDLVKGLSQECAQVGEDLQALLTAIKQ